ncbi:MAG: 30S ribosomal protein S18 [Deltaproteobacteria bacterium]|nr:30S ribosomal protein S18 [Deltaproteobacteria bacterium]
MRPEKPTTATNRLRKPHQTSRKPHPKRRQPRTTTRPRRSPSHGCTHGRWRVRRRARRTRGSRLYKDPKSLRLFVAEVGKMIPRRISGNCAKHQRKLAIAIKRARHIALLPYSGQGQ